ncbi:glycosyltransferase family A protein [Chitinophaga agri]|uniref:Glycosyltransferase family 2 protein n=1 Tax=Chitinophaga agri TaxID=2703787 RepID=A0A6B9ZKW3_9BACT|nr:glycosyltransferase family A protein [Chitinophaga agri]QHS63038.1 glycosyltransferase family 2 protein [Chitinophaga agri]
MDTPVLLLIFNRPAQTMRILESIRMQQPARLFIAADGPRPLKPGDAALCQETRETVLNYIDWPCEVSTLFREQNMGCAKAVSSGINWFFSQVEEGIILEDDCLPDPTFYHFCTTLLEHHRHNDQVMHIGGSNYQAGIIRGNASYYYSRYAHIWGWATWRRAWQYYDVSLQRYRHASREDLPPQFERELDAFFEERMDTWDTQWFLSVLFNKGLAITPNTNIIRNIGYGKEATHTKNEPAWFKKMVYGSISHIIHPDTLTPDSEADAYTLDTVFRSSYLFHMVRKIVKSNPLLYNLYKRIS